MQKYLIIFLFPFLAFAQLGSDTRLGKFDQLDSNSATEISILKELEALTTGAWKLPLGNTAARPAGEAGQIRYNSELETFEGFTTEWGPIAGGGLAKWETGVEYAVDTVIWEPISKKVYVCNTLHTSGATFAGDIANWDELSNPFDGTNLLPVGNSLTSTDTNGNVDLKPDGTGDATVTYGTNELSLNPTSGRDSLLKNPSFETGEVEYACTNATGAIVASTIPSQNDAKMFQMTVTAAGGYCDFIVTTGAKFEGLPFIIGGLFQTELLDVEYCTLVNGAESNCIPVNAIADDTTDPFNKALSTQDLSGATSNGLRIKTTSSTSGVINSSKIALDLGTLPTGQAISCNGELDCENVFVGVYDYLEANPSLAVKAQTPSAWISSTAKSGTGNSTKTFTVPNGVFSATPNCQATVEGTTTVEPSYQKGASTPTSLVFQTRLTTDGSTIDRSFTISCTKAAPDFKPIIERGVVNVGQANNSYISAYRKGSGDQAISAGVVTVDLTDVNSFSRGITFNAATDEFTFLKGGRFVMSASVPFFTTTGQLFELYPEIDKGAGYASIEGVEPTSFFNIDRYMPNADFVFSANAGDKVRLRAFSSGSSAINASVAGLGPVVTIYSTVDQQQIQASIIDRKIYDGNEYPAKEIAVVGGVEKQVYRRCYEIASDITTTTTIATIDAGLEMLRAQRFLSDAYYFGEYSYLVSGTDQAGLRYFKNTGVLDYLVVGRTVFADTRPCIYYTKP